MKGVRGKHINREHVCFLVWEIAMVIIFYSILGIEWTGRYRKWQLFAIAICALPITTVIHESIHYIVIRIFSRDKVTFGIERSGLWIKYVFIHTDARFPVWQWVLVKTAPAVILTVIPTLLMILSGYRGMMAFCIVMINFTASYKDFIDTIHIMKNKSDKSV